MERNTDFEGLRVLNAWAPNRLTGLAETVPAPGQRKPAG